MNPSALSSFLIHSKRASIGNLPGGKLHTAINITQFSPMGALFVRRNSCMSINFPRRQAFRATSFSSHYFFCTVGRLVLSCVLAQTLSFAKCSSLWTSLANSITHSDMPSHSCDWGWEGECADLKSEAVGFLVLAWQGIHWCFLQGWNWGMFTRIPNTSCSPQKFWNNGTNF